MKNAVQIVAQDREWKTKTTKDTHITVKYNISESFDENGKKVPLVEYTTTSTDSVDIEKCISVIKDISKHKVFLSEKDSEILDTISENEWLIYYYFNPIWPLKKSDCVSKMKYEYNIIDKKAVFTIIAAPSLYRATNVQRFSCYSTIYTFQEVENNKLIINITAKMSPAINVPVWLIKIATPYGALDIHRKILLLATQ